MGKRIKADKVDNFNYVVIPKALFDDRYKDIDGNAKLLYGLLLDRTELSKKNNWVDKNNDVYIYFTRVDAQQELNLSDKTATKIFKQLIKYELIEEERQGRGKPNRLYVCEFELSTGEDKTRKKYDSRLVKSTTLDSYNLRPNNTNISKPDLKSSKTTFKNFEERSYDPKALEEELLKKSKEAF